MRGRLDLARRERERLQMLERRAAERTEHLAIAEGVAETVGLSRARGSAIEAPQPAPGRREGHYRRQPGLEWLTRKGRLSAAQRAAGERYGACYRRAKVEGSIPSTLNIKPRTSAPGGAPLSAILSHAEGTAQAAARLVILRGRLSRQRDLVAACDQVCGEELTPREAAAGEREAGRLEAVLLVALDILASEA
ncbi:hypothetical protein [Phenylobacterium sp.]|uniref:hypothetical protein n=1 Tax=Phenylobacterium sp. TaxID=1871053 RepID=UPI002F3E5C7C